MKLHVNKVLIFSMISLKATLTQWTSGTTHCGGSFLRTTGTRQSRCSPPLTLYTTYSQTLNWSCCYGNQRKGENQQRLLIDITSRLLIDLIPVYRSMEHNVIYDWISFNSASLANQWYFLYCKDKTLKLKLKPLPMQNKKYFLRSFSTSYSISS